MRGQLIGTAAWIGVTALAGTLVAGAVRVAVDSVASPASLSPPAPHLGQPVPVDNQDGPGSPGGAAGPGSGPTTTGPAGDRIQAGTSRPGAGGSTSAAGAAGGTSSASTALTSVTGTPAPPRPGGATTTTTPGTTSSTTSTTTASTTTTSRPTYSYRLRGGTVGVQCTDDAVSLAYATPNSGFTTRVLNSGPSVVDVKFQSPDWKSEIQVTCANGQPQPHTQDQAT